ncbi:MAG: nitrilase-related carbon-nitrogen hydrolase [Spirochaetaceae bacterium]
MKFSILLCAAVFLLFLFPRWDLPVYAADAPEGGVEESVRTKTLGVAAVQYTVKAERYGSLKKFSQSVEDLLASAVEMGAEVVVFPEYINVFLAFRKEMEALSRAESIEEGLQMVGADSAGSLFMERSVELRRVMDRIWGQFARENSLWIVAGSYFAVEGDKLYNRSPVYGPSGELVYEQDKAALTPFEKDVLKLSPGRSEEADTFEVEGWDFALTICRDTFFDRWNTKFEDADVWIDIKANGAEYTQQIEELFEDALPERIEETEVPYGVTACLNGELLELFWEGPSSIIRWKKRGEKESDWEYIKRAKKEDREEVLVAELRLPGDANN